jgi:hypothetical protein
VTAQKSRPAAATVQEAKVAGNISDDDVEQPQLSESAGGDSLPDVRLPDVHLPDVPLPDVPRPDVPLTEACSDGSEGDE